MTIKVLEEHNFGPHKDLRLDLDPGVNALVGRSARGKSWAGLRALRKVAFNKPLGDGFIRWGADECWIDMELAEGPSVCYRKDKGGAEYLLDDKVSENPLEFRAFGQGVPEEVSKALNLGEINFQGQHQPLFLLSMSPTEIAKVLNELAGLDDIDVAYKRINGRLWQEQQDTKNAKADRDHLSKELERYEGLDLLEERTKVCQQLENEAVKQAGRAIKLSTLAGLYGKARTDLSQYDQLPEAKAQLRKLQEKGEEAKQQLFRAQDLAKLAQRHQDWSNWLRALQPTRNLKDRIAKLETLKEELERVKVRQHDLSTILAKISQLEREARELGRELAEKRLEWEKTMPEQCPICGAPKGWEVCHG